MRLVRRPINPALHQHIVRSGTRPLSLAAVAGFRHYYEFLNAVRSTSVVASPKNIERLHRVADALGYPRDEIFLDGGIGETRRPQEANDPKSADRVATISSFLRSTRSLGARDTRRGCAEYAALRRQDRFSVQTLRGHVEGEAGAMTSMAAWFHDHNIGVFPVVTPGKTPACASWDDYECTRGQAERFRNYGVRLGVLSVVDSDSAATETWADRHVPETPFMVRTCRGWHRYFRLANPLPKFIYGDGHTIEFRNHGLYVVGPGSIHAGDQKKGIAPGHVYAASDWSWRWDDIPFFSADFVFDDGSCGTQAASRGRGTQAASGSSGERFQFPEVVKEAGRHDTLFRQIRSWKHTFDQADAREYIHLMNLAHCRPPLEEDEDFNKWFLRAWKMQDRPFPDAPTVQGYDARLLRRLGLRL